MNEHKMIETRKYLEEQIKSIELELSHLPKKNIFCCKNGPFYKWYESDGKNNKYIPKKNRIYAEELAKKKYLTLLREDMLQEKKAIDLYLKHHSSIGGKAESLLVNNPAYTELLAPYYHPISQDLLEWTNSPYERNELYPEKLIHRTSAGIYVRSKSEALIASLLYRNKIPFRYEETLRIGDVHFSPDFTIRHPETGKTFYWEHFGMMDAPEYSKSAFSKMQVYANYGIIIGHNLIATFETKDHPLEFEMVEQTIDYYF